VRVMVAFVDILRLCVLIRLTGPFSYKMPARGGLHRMNIESIMRFAIAGLIGMVLLCMTLAGIAFAAGNRPDPGRETDNPGKIHGIAFESLQVSNLERSVKYYRALGFALMSDANQPWTVDEAANRLYKTPGAKSRTAALTILRTASGQPFTLYLRQYKDLERGSRIDFPARDPSAAHFGLMVPKADALWEQLRSAGMLRPLSWGGKLIRMPGQTLGGLAYVMDPDGFNIEIIGTSRESTAASDQKKPPNNHPTMHHLGLVVLNSDKARAFYGDLLGAKFPDTLPEWVSGDNYDAVVGGHGYVIRLINGAFPEAGAPQKTMSLELVEYKTPGRTKIDDYGYSDVAVSCVGLQVEDLDALYSRLKAAGVEVWSQGGIVQRKDGSRAVVVRDPDVGAFVELFERP
jgi:catechol 2,3-dioxygenase-like lactoylglutathione lyase family enzyme